MIWQRQHCDLEWKVYVLQDMVKRVLYEFHDSLVSGHLGIDKTLRVIRRYHYWLRMYNDITRYVRNCVICVCCKSLVTNPGKIRPHQPKHPWKIVSVDLIGPYSRALRRKKFILVPTDLFS